MSAQPTPVPAGKSGEGFPQNHRPILDAMFAPKSVALIGASESRNSIGRALMENLKSFKGDLFPINPNRETVLEHKTFPAICNVPGAVDLAVIATPASTVPAVVEECAAAGVKGAVIISAGFKECGPAGVELEKQILARCGQMRIIGPNCVGVMLPHIGLNATFAKPLALPGSIGFISQSGALCAAILDWSLSNQLGFSAFISIGSMLDMDWGDLIYHLGDDPHTRSILLYMESIGDARSFLSAAREVALTKPIIVIKVGRTEAAAKAAASHTGAMTGSDEVCDAAFRRAGVLRVNTIGELFNVAELLGKQPRARGPRLAIVTNGGGPGALAADTLIANGGESAALSSESLAALDRVLPPHWSHGNPVDVIGDADAERYGRAVDVVSRDPGNDGVLVVLTPQAVTAPMDIATKLTSFARLEGKPILASFMGGESVAEAVAILDRAGIPAFAYPDSAARAFCYLWQYTHALRALYETPALTVDAESFAARAKAKRIIECVQQSGRTLLTEPESKELLAAYGIPVVPTIIATSEKEAVEKAAQFAGPAVLKVYSHTITHKTDVGGVKLDLDGEAAVRLAYREIEEAVRSRGKGDDFGGVVVQPMIARDGYELILGSSVDPQFGPVLLFGAGGQLVEVFCDRALGLPPLNRTLARRMTERTRIHRALKGVRGRAPVDLAVLEEMLVRFSQLVVEQPRIKEIDINPLLASAEGIVALDARVVLHPVDIADEELPRTAIRPYPAQYISTITLANGTSITVRPIRPEDEPKMVNFHQSLSERSVRFRYFGAMSVESRTGHQRLVRACFNDYDREIALVAERKQSDHGPEIIGVGRLIKAHGVNEAEFAIVIADAWQGLGLGTALLKLLVEAGRAEKLRRISGRILAENAAMLEMSRKIGFALQWRPDEGEWEAEIRL
jgi:acetyltransferase